MSLLCDDPNAAALREAVREAVREALREALRDERSRT
jgi:hypothetical protein